MERRLAIGLLVVFVAGGIIGGLIGYFGISRDQDGNGSPQSATVYVVSDDKNINGTVTFTLQPDGSIKVVGTLLGLPQGKHGFHVHEKGDLSGGCGSTKGHFNPFGKSHGGPSSEERHVGDLGNIEADSSSRADISITDSVIKLEGEASIIGRAVVVHAGEDDLGEGGFPDSKTTGHAGARLACGVIGVLS